MRNLVPYERPRGALHDLARVSTLSPDRCYILCVSERTLYLLQNFAALDVGFRSRYVVEYTDHGYRPTDAAHALDSTYLEAVESFRLEVLDMNCDIGAGLQAIADAIASSGGGGCCGGGGNVATEPCISDLDNESLLGPPDSTQGNPASDPPPEGFATWEEYYTYKCQAAVFIWELERRHMVMLRNFEGLALVASIVAPSVAGLAGVLPAAFTPAGFVVFVTSVVAIGVVAAASWFYMDEMIAKWDADKDAIICALYSSGTSPQAVSALANFLEDAIQSIVTWGALAPVAGTISGLLSTAFAELAGNGIVEPLFKSVAAVQASSYDCSSCDEGQADLFLTGLLEPYNRLVIGESITFYNESTTLGYQARNSNDPRLFLEFIAGATNDSYIISGQVSAPDHPGETMNYVIHVEHWNGSAWGPWESLGPFEFNPDVWTYFEQEFTTQGIVQGELYRVQFGVQEFNWYGWFRQVKGQTS